MFGPALATDRLTTSGHLSAIGPSTTTFAQISLSDWDRELPLADYLAVQLQITDAGLSVTPGIAVYWAHIFNGTTIGLLAAAAYWRPLWPGDFGLTEPPIITTIRDSFVPRCGGRLALVAVLNSGGAGETFIDYTLDIHVKTRSLTGSNSGTILNHPTQGITRPTP